MEQAEELLHCVLERSTSQQYLMLLKEDKKHKREMLQYQSDLSETLLCHAV